MITDKSIKEVYRKSAGCYDLRFESLSGQITDRKQKEALLSCLKGIPKKAKILEVGCGTGRFLEFLQKEGYKNIYGIDQSEEMLDVAGKKTSANLKIGDVYKIPYKKDFFDAVFSVHVLMHVEDSRKMINEMRRVSKNIVIFDINNRFSFSGFAPVYRKIMALFGRKIVTSPKTFSLGQVKRIVRKNFSYTPTFYLPLRFRFPEAYFRNYDAIENIIKKIMPKRFAAQLFILLQTHD